MNKKNSQTNTGRDTIPQIYTLVSVKAGADTQLLTHLYKNSIRVHNSIPSPYPQDCSRVIFCVLAPEDVVIQLLFPEPKNLRGCYCQIEYPHALSNIKKSVKSVRSAKESLPFSLLSAIYEPSFLRSQ